MVAAFPAAKLAALFLKQISKPIANLCKEQAKSSPIFRKYVCMPPAQFYNWCEIKMKMWILNLGKPVNIPVLNEAMAIDLGATLLGEGILFTIAAAILINEYSRSARKEEKKENEIKAEKERLVNAIQDLYMNTEKQATQIRELTRMIYDLEQRVVQKPWKPRKDPPTILDEPSGPSSPPPIIIEQQTDEFEVKPNEEERKVVPTKKVLRKKKSPDNNKGNDPPPHTSSIILQAVAIIESEMFVANDAERKPSLLALAIDHIYKDVYRIPLSFN